MNEHRKLDGNKKDTKLRARVSDLSPTNLILLLFAGCLTGMCLSDFFNAISFDMPLNSRIDVLLLFNVVELVLAFVLLYCITRRESRVLEASEEGQNTLRISNYSLSSLFLLVNGAMLSANSLLYLLDYLIRPLYDLLPQEPNSVRLQSMQLLWLFINLIVLLLGLLLAFYVLRQTRNQASPKDMPPSNKENKS